MAKLTDKRIRYIIRHKERGDLKNWQIAVGVKVGIRRVQQMYKKYNETGDNSIKTLDEAEKEAASFNYMILAINTDRGSQFYANNKNKKRCPSPFADA